MVRDSRPPVKCDASDDAAECPSTRELAQPGRWHQWAMEHSGNAEFLRAAEFIRHAIVLDPLDPLLRFDLGVALCKAELLNEAHDAFSQALRLDPTWEEPLCLQRQLTKRLTCDTGGRASNAGLLLGLAPSSAARRPTGTLFCPESTFANDVLACVDLVSAIDRLYPTRMVNAQFIALAGEHLAHSALLIAIARRLTGVLGKRRDRASEWMTIADGRAAKAFALRAVRQQPEFESLITAALVLQLIGEHRHALVLLERALHDKPDDIQAMTSRAEVLIELGEGRAGAELLSSIIDPRSARSRQRLMRAKSGSADRDAAREIGEVEAILHTTTPPSPQRSLLHYTLAWRYEQVGDMDRAFHALAQASEEKKACFLKANPDPECAISRVAETIREYDESFFEQRRGWGVASRRPLFIVGMPRSGTTLVEQILARHQEIFAAGELRDMAIIARTISNLGDDHCREAQQPAPYPARLKQLTLSEIMHFGRQHIASLSTIHRDATYVIDKMPTNFQLLGMIAVMFPNARIIHCTRNPIDICVSCYKNNLAWPFFDLDALADYFLSYQSLMRHWMESIPLRMLEVRYEHVVDDLEAESRRLLGFLELCWTDDCLSFHQADRGIRTPSHWQVRRPIYQTSVEAWRPWEPHIQPLLRRLSDVPVQCAS